MLTLFLAGTALNAVSCGGGSSGTPSGSVPTLGGSGYLGPLNATVSFVVNVPPLQKTNSAKRRRPDDNVYVSPDTGSVSITVGLVNGLSVAHPPPPSVVVVPHSCVGASGCRLSLPNVPAAVGQDQFVVTTNAGPSSASALISVGTVDVTVTSAGPNGGVVGNPTELSIGGFVASLELAVEPDSLAYGTPETSTVDVIARDAGGAIIIGNTLFAYPIEVTSNDPKNFALSEGGATGPVVLAKPETPAQIVLRYSGGAFGARLAASSTNGDNAAVEGSLQLRATIPVSPTPSGAPAPSLYVLNGFDNTVSEIGLSGARPAFRRAFGGDQIGCAPSFSSSSLFGDFVEGVSGLAPSPSGALLVGNGSCKQMGSAQAVTIYAFSPAATGAAAPAATYSDSSGALTLIGYLQPDPLTGQLYADGGSSFTFLRLAVSGKSIAFGATFGSGDPKDVLYGCFLPSSTGVCDSNSLGATVPGNGPMLAEHPVVTDSAGNAYAVAASQALVAAGSFAIVRLPAASLSSTETTTIVISPAWLTTQTTTPTSFAIDGNTIYFLNNADGSSAANCDAVRTSSPSNACADGDTHEYITAFDLSQFDSGAGPRNVSPVLTIGGDSSRFEGSKTEALAGNLFERIAARDGKVYVANIFPGDCLPSTLCGQYMSAIGNPAKNVNANAGEIEVYDGTLRGYHVNDQKPSAAAGTAIAGSHVKSPIGIVFAAPGSVTGGASSVRPMRQGRYPADVLRRLQRTPISRSRP